jgi:hypothetical protein
LNLRAIFKHQTNKKTGRKLESQFPELGIRPALKKDYQRRKVRLEQKHFLTNKII